MLAGGLMRKLVLGCAVAGLLVLSPKSEARLPASLGPLPPVFQTMPKGQVGLASWYGSERHGKTTASGEVFDMNALTAAHRTLPLGSKVRVTNLKNLKSTLLKINDRGPGIEGRLIDVSWAAAQKLGFVNAGLALVEVEVIPFSKVGHPAITGPRSAKLN
jgi:rare lipoprotein A